jgi:hypothetical protein
MLYVFGAGFQDFGMFIIEFVCFASGRSSEYCTRITRYYREK